MEIIVVPWRKHFSTTVPLGSIPEFPAETCEEIKRSEEGEATSGEYWLYSIITGKTVLVSCDMEREGNKTEVIFVLVVDINITFLIPVM